MSQICWMAIRGQFILFNIHVRKFFIIKYKFLYIFTFLRIFSCLSRRDLLLDCRAWRSDKLVQPCQRAFNKIVSQRTLSRGPRLSDVFCLSAFFLFFVFFCFQSRSDNNQFASCGGDNNAHICDISKGIVVRRFRGHVAVRIYFLDFFKLIFFFFSLLYFNFNFLNRFL